MLAFFRKSANSVAIKGLLVLLLLTFVLWGIGDSLHFGEHRYVLKVGDKKYEEREFAMLYHQYASMLQHQSGYQFSKADLNDPQLKRILMSMIISNLLQLELARSMQFSVSDDMVKFEIASMPMFLRDGRFDKNLFEQYLRQSGLSEEGFITLLKEEMSSKTLDATLSVLRFAPTNLVNALLEGQGQSRVVSVINIPKSLAKVVVEPTQAELEAVYNELKPSLLTPELRDVSYVVFGGEIVGDIGDVSEAELKGVYEARKNTFTQPQKRSVKQLIIKNDANAALALDELLAGANLDKVASKYSGDKKPLGVVGRDFFNNDMGDVVFSLELNKPSQLIKSPLGNHIFIVDQIIPQRVKSFDEVRSIVRTAYLEEKRFEKLQAIVMSLDKEILAGRSLADIAKERGFKIATISKAASDSKAGMMQNQQFSGMVFSTSEGLTSMVSPLENEKYFIASVDKIYPSTPPTLDDAKNVVVKAWNGREEAKMLSAKAQEIYNGLAGGANVEQVVQQYSLSAPQEVTVLNGNTVGNWDTVIMQAAFSAKVGEYSAPYKTTDGNYAIFMVKKIIDATQTWKSANEPGVREKLLSEIPNEFLDQLLSYTRKEFKVEIDEKLYEEMKF